MKKLSVLLIIAILTLILTACDGAGTASLSSATVNNSSSSEISSQQNQVESQKASINETVLIDESGVKITAKELKTGGLFGAELKLLIENNSGMDLTFQCRNASVNGYMVEPMMSVDVANEKKANDSMTFTDSELSLCGIKEIADMEFSFHVFDSDSWDTYLDTAQIQLKTSLADNYHYTFDDSGDIAYEENGIKITVKGLAENSSLFGTELVVYIENNSDENITVQTRDFSVNGFMVNPIFSSDVMSGKHSIGTITFLSSELEDNDITKFESAELSFHIFNAQSWDTIVDTDVINLSF